MKILITGASGFVGSNLRAQSEKLVTLIWANEEFDPMNSDTYSLPIE